MELITDRPITRKVRSDKLSDSYKVRIRRTFPFIGWDGEGYTRNGKHYYALFGNSEGARVQGPSLTYQECLPLLLEAPKEAIHIIFAGTYDVIMMFRDTKQRESLLRAQWVTIGQYRCRFLKGKSFTVKDTVSGQSRILYDVFSFFGTSFVKACREYLPLDLIMSDGRTLADFLDSVEAMKYQRAEFATMTAEIKDYMSMELELLAMLGEELRKRLAAVDIYPVRWHGPGAVASAVLKANDVNSHRREQPLPLVKAAEAAYYGGRFEMFKRGTYIGPVYQYDIRSAYPYAMSLLPSLDVEWTHRTTNVKVTKDFALYRVKLRTDEPTVPYRNGYGMIYYPYWCMGWYWGCELPEGRKALEVWEPSSVSGSPFSFVQDMYDRRAQLKREGKPEQLALKLALNSLYGKLAQSKGANWNGKQWQKPTYHEPLWAGYITAYTRSMIQHAVELAGPNLIAVETDAVFSLQPLDLPLGSALGQWEETRYEGIKYVQSGVHMTLQDDEWSYKTRGLTMRRSQSDRNLWDDLLDRGSVTIAQVRFGTDVRQPATFGKWYEQKRKLTLDHIEALEKRINVGPCPNCTPDEDGFYRIPDYENHLHPMVVPPIPMEESTPYRFIWHTAYDDDDPILYLEYQPEILTEERVLT